MSHRLPQVALLALVTRGFGHRDSAGRTAVAVHPTPFVTEWSISECRLIRPSASTALRALSVLPGKLLPLLQPSGSHEETCA